MSIKRPAVLRGVLAGCIAVCLAMLGVATWIIIQRPQDEITIPMDAVAARSEVGGPFEMIDHNGNTVTEGDFRGRYMLIFFGYTFCPDVCPTELGAMAAALDELGPEADEVTPIFVTVDPTRDTPEVLAEYVALFHPRIVGLTGSAEQLAAMARAYHVFYAKGSGEDDDYLMEHTAMVYLMGPDGTYLGILPPGTPPDDLAEAVRQQLAETPG